MSELWVVVPAHNEELRLPAALHALGSQLDQDFTLCIVDNASSDSTAEIAQRFAENAPFPVVVLHEPEKGVGSAVDTAMRYAIEHGASELGRTDADTVVTPDWTREIKHGFSSGAELLIGSMDARSDETGQGSRLAFTIAVTLAEVFGRVRPAHRGNAQPYRMHAGFNMAITAALYLRCGGMPRRPSPTDRLFMNRVRDAHGIVRHVPAMHAQTSMRRFQRLGVIGTARWYLDGGAHTVDPR